MNTPENKHLEWDKGRIAYYAPSWPPHLIANGINTYVDTTTKSLNSLSIPTSVVTANWDNTHENVIRVLPPSFYDKTKSWIARHSYYGAPPKLLLEKKQFAERVSKAIRKAHRQSPIALLEIEETFGFARWLSLPKEIPIVVRLHGPRCQSLEVNPATTEQDAFRLQEEGELIKQAKWITAPSNFVLECVRNYYQLDLPEAIVIPNQVPEPPAGVRWDPAKCDPNQILFVGRLDYPKGADLIIEAFNQVAKTHSDITLMMVGPEGVGIKKSESFNHLLLKTIRDPSIRKRINLTGKLSPEKVWQLRTHSGLTLVASRYENAPAGILEPGVIGAPVIASNNTGIAEIFQGVEPAFLFNSGHADSLAKCMKETLCNKKIWPFLGAALQRKIKKTYSRDIVMPRLIHHYKSIIDASER